MKIGQMLGGRRKGPRTKPGKKKASPKKKKQVKVKLKISGNVNQVTKAVQQLASPDPQGAAKGVSPVNPELKQDLI